MANSTFEEVHFATAAEFLSALSPFDQFWSTRGTVDHWRFRGQRRSKWHLHPTSMRPGAFKHYGIGAVAVHTPKNLTEQLERENEAVVDFKFECLDAHLPLPEDGQWFRSGDLHRLAFGDQSIQDEADGIDVPFPLYRSLFALAQHHHVPTRLLDWTDNAFIAAYFACIEVARSMALNLKRHFADEDLAVWALRDLACQRVDEFALNDFKRPTIESVSAPYEGNPNLRAQRGSFTLVKYRSPRAADDFKLPPLDQVIRDYERDKYKGLEGASRDLLLLKLTLPQSEARKLLRRLREIGVRGATVFPQYSAIVPSLRERRYWA